jgi:hypothetical protein
VALSADQKAMLQLLLERGQSYDDLASILGVDATEVRSRARAALTELAGADPDRNVALTDYMLGQADPIDRADAVRHLKDDSEDLAMASELAQKLRLVAPEAQLPRLPGEERQPRQRRPVSERAPAPLRRLMPSRPPKAKRDEPREPRTSLTKRQTQGIVVGAFAAVLLTVGILAIAGVFSGSEPDAATTTNASTNAAVPTGKPQGYPLLPIAGADGPGQVKLASDGSFQDSIPIPTAVQPILQNVQAIAITLSKNAEVSKSIQKAVQSKQALLDVQGHIEFIGVAGARKKNTIPIQLQPAKGVKGSGAAALGVATNKTPFFQVNLKGLEQPSKNESYIIWLVVGSTQGSQGQGQ